MRIVGVIDVREGCAVHARGGQRRAYAPVEVAAGQRIDGDVRSLARAYVEVLGVRELYLADLDAIEGRTEPNRDLIASTSALGATLWVDAGISTLSRARLVLEAGASAAIVGLETLSSFAHLEEICSTIGGERIAFSVDLRNGVPIALPDVVPGTWAAADVASRAARAGATSIILLDLARVGTGSGIDLDLIGAVRRGLPGVTLLAGGGVRDDADLERLASAGCDGALVATALLAGRIELGSDR
jgi:phosphoribosylformimino-5-aminoimidazole carboxamide ribotide isomerase